MKVIINTTNKWKFISVLSKYFHNAFKELERMKKEGTGNFTFAMDGSRYSFDVRNGVYKLVRTQAARID